jgi:hypothetical protein
VPSLSSIFSLFAQDTSLWAAQPGSSDEPAGQPDISFARCRITGDEIIALDNKGRSSFQLGFKADEHNLRVNCCFALGYATPFASDVK